MCDINFSVKIPKLKGGGTYCCYEEVFKNYLSKNSLDSTITNLNEARVSHYFLLCTTNAWNCLNRIACVLLCLPTASVT